MTTDVRMRRAQLQVGWREAPSGPRGRLEGRPRSGSSARPISRPSAGEGGGVMWERALRTRTPARASSADCAPMARPSVARCAHSQRTGCLPETRPTKVRLHSSSHRLRPGDTLDSGLGTAIACLMDGGAALLPPWARTTDKRPQLGCGARRHPDGHATRLPQLDLAFPRGGTVEDQRTTAGLDAARALRARHRAVWAASIRPRGPGAPIQTARRDVNTARLPHATSTPSRARPSSRASTIARVLPPSRAGPGQSLRPSAAAAAAAVRGRTLVFAP